MYKNMKIEINEQQPLDDVVEELERLGYKGEREPHNFDKYIVSYSYEYQNPFGKYVGYYTNVSDFPLTTLAELKEM